MCRIRYLSLDLRPYDSPLTRARGRRRGNGKAHMSKFGPMTRRQLRPGPTSNGFLLLPSGGRDRRSTVVRPELTSLTCGARTHATVAPIPSMNGNAVRSTTSSSIIPVDRYSAHSDQGGGRSRSPVPWTAPIILNPCASTRPDIVSTKMGPRRQQP